MKLILAGEIAMAAACRRRHLKRAVLLGVNEADRGERVSVLRRAEFSLPQPPA